MENDSSALTPRDAPQTGLLPCPFCGGPAKATPDGAGWPLVVCNPCGAYVEAVNGTDDPVPRWNRRPAHDDLVAALREIIAINDESTGDCRKRMGTRRGNSIVVARAALAKAGQAPEPRGEADPSNPRP